MSAGTNRNEGPDRQRTCRRCGTCCRKGGPTLHTEDRGLVESGIIPAHNLYTIRCGEMAFDNVRAALTPVAGDHIKLKGKDTRWACCLYDDDQKACRGYDRRPLECRTLKCWDTHEIERIYGSDLLTRQDLIGGVDGLWDLVADHQRRCDYDVARQLIRHLERGDRERARSKLLQLVQYDIEIRRLVIQMGGAGAEMLDFLFGRPMSETLKAEGLNLQPKPK